MIRNKIQHYFDVWNEIQHNENSSAKLYVENIEIIIVKLRLLYTDENSTDENYLT